MNHWDYPWCAEQPMQRGAGFCCNASTFCCSGEYYETGGACCGAGESCISGYGKCCPPSTTGCAAAISIGADQEPIRWDDDATLALLQLTHHSCPPLLLACRLPNWQGSQGLSDLDA
jgi:hypothetical protein